MQKKNQNGRREGAQQRLELQLERGEKNTKDGPKKLADQDVKRIQKEIARLEEPFLGYRKTNRKYQTKAA